jgi:hypothetical protein
MPKATRPLATPTPPTSPNLTNGRESANEFAMPEAPPPTPSLRDLVRERLKTSKDPNPHTAIEGLLADLDENLLRAAARKGLAEIATEIVRSINSHNLRTRPNESAKWNAAKTAVDERPDIFAQRICVGHDEHGNGIWRYLGDCSPGDLQSAEHIKRLQAEGLVSGADRLAQLRKQLKKNQIVRDLAPSKVEEIINA